MFNDRWVTVIALVAVVIALGILAIARVDGAAVACFGAAGSVVLALTRGLADHDDSTTKLIPVFLVALAASASACADAARQARPTAYGVELEECSRKSPTLAESITCENEVRGRYGRQPRQMPSDGGGE